MSARPPTYKSLVNSPQPLPPSQCQKSLTQSEFLCCSLLPRPFSVPIFLHLFPALLPSYLPALLPASLCLFPYLCSNSASYTLLHHCFLLLLASLSVVFISQLSSSRSFLLVVHFNLLSSVLFQVFLSLYLLRSGPPAASSGACKGVKTAVCGEISLYSGWEQVHLRWSKVKGKNVQHCFYYISAGDIMSEHFFEWKFAHCV